MSQGNNIRRKPPTNGPPRPQKKRRKPRRRGRRTLHHLLLLLLILAAGAVLSLTVFFKIEDITVVGDNHYTPEDIIEATGIELEDNLLLLQTQTIEEHLLDTFPYIEEVSVQKVFPPGVEIQVTPSVAVAALEQSGHNYILITYDGKILEEGLTLPPADALLVHGVPIKDMHPGDQLGEWSKEGSQSGETLEAKEARQERNQQKEQTAQDQKGVLRMLHYLFDAMEESGFDQMTNIDLTDRYNMKIRYENRMSIELGTEISLAYKLTYAKKILEQHLHPDAPGVLDLAGIQRNRVYYQPAEGYRNDGSALSEDPYEPPATPLAAAEKEEPELDTATEHTEESADTPPETQAAAVQGEIATAEDLPLPETEDSTKKVHIPLEDLE